MFNLGTTDYVKLHAVALLNINYVHYNDCLEFNYGNLNTRLKSVGASAHGVTL